MIKNKKKTFSEFWLDDYDYRYDVLTGERLSDGKDYHKMASTLRAISNFVNIVTGQSIPVEYSTKDDSFTNGKKVTISGNIKDDNFDSTVGLALHEGSHILLTDFKVLKNLINYSSIPGDLRRKIVKKYFWEKPVREADWNADHYIVNIVKSLLNYVEDRRIDNFIYKSAPGYRGYYQSMYDRYFNDKIIDKGLKSDDKRTLDWDSYLFRIINFTNPNRDLDALPGLRDIWNLLDLKNISRLQSTADALDIAFEIFNIVESNIQGQPEDSKKSDDNQKNEDSKKSDDNQKNKDSKKSDDNRPRKKLTSSEQIKLDKKIKEAIEAINGSIKKSKLSNSDKNKVKAIQSSSSEFKQVGIVDENGTYTKTPCLVVRNLTLELAKSGIYETFCYDVFSTNSDEPIISNGLRLGTMLGRKLQIRNDSNSLKYNRLNTGKIDKRMIASLGYGNEQVFNQIFVDKFTPSIVHISIDASGSMMGSKWEKALTAAIAIAKAASMVQNLDVVLSYRSTEDVGNKTTPAIFIAYDSRKDKISKIRELFQYIQCSGTTPEGLCFEAIQNEMVSSSGSIDSYFINFSDGEPYFQNIDIKYRGAIACTHTKKQVDIMRNKGIKVLSYFISDSSRYLNHFKYMYGKDAQIVNVSQLLQLANSLNKRFSTR